MQSVTEEVSELIHMARLAHLRRKYKTLFETGNYQIENICQIQHNICIKKSIHMPQYVCPVLSVIVLGNILLNLYTCICMPYSMCCSNILLNLF